jgi:hypothetical protein
MRLPEVVFGLAAYAAYALCFPWDQIGCCAEIGATAVQQASTGQQAADEQPSGRWVRGKLNVYQPLWGLRGGLLFGIQPHNDAKGRPPRGLIAIHYPVLNRDEYNLINFIAVEPIVGGQRGLSELELSRLDGVPGKRIWASVESGDARPQTPVEPGKLTLPMPGVEQLEVVLRVERFDNGAHVCLVVTQRSDAPDEIQFTLHAEPDSAPLQYCVLTATMGNKARTRLLWLNNDVVSSQRLYPSYRELGFVPHSVFPLQRLLRTEAGDVLVAVTTDEQDPAAVFPFPGTRLWYYGGAKVTQYWRKPKATFGNALCAAVNARYTYWGSKQPIPGGIAFENFEMREPFSEGQCFAFGMTRRTPADLGFRAATHDEKAAK